jgi:hypothetical protein
MREAVQFTRIRKNQLYESPMNKALETQGSIIVTRNWLARIVLFPSKKHHKLLYSLRLYSNPYSNAGKLQR